MLWRAGRDCVVRDLSLTVEELRIIPPFEFANWAVFPFGGISNNVQLGDTGVNGRIFPISSSAPPRKQQEGELGPNERWYPSAQPSDDGYLLRVISSRASGNRSLREQT